MECVSEYLASQDEPVSRASIERSVSGKAEYVRQAIGALVEEGYARETEGKGGAKPIEFVRFYREADDDFEGPEGDEPTSSRPRPSTSSRPVVKKTVPLLGDDGFDEFLIAAVEASQITQAEASERYEFGKLIRAALAS